MTDLLSDVDAPSDAELISRVRGGDVAAYGQLFTRHRDAANRLARQLVRGPDSDDLVAEAFAKVLTVLQGGGGPDVAFRAYLLTAVRRLHVDRVRAGQRVQTTDDLTPFDPGIPFQDTAVAGFESGAAAKAFASLPERWQLVLWHLEVEGQKPADIAPLLGMSANSVSALAYRAREGLRQAFLTMHLSDLTETDCRWVTEHLGAFVRKGLSKRDSGKVQDHLDECRRCTAMYLELTEVNDNLAGIIAPLLLGAAATGYLASGAGSAGLFALVSSRIKDFLGANTGAVSAAGVTVGVAAAAIAVFTLGGGGGARPEAKAPEAPVGVTSAASPSVGSPSPLAPSASPPAAAPTIAPTTTLSPAGVALFSPSAGFPTATASEPATIESPSASPSESLSESPAETPSGSTESPSTEPTTEPTTPGPTDVDVSLAGTTVDDDGVHLVTNGSPLPPTVTVALSSASEGVGFARNGDCPVAPNGREATCDLSPAGAGARTPATAVRFTGTSYSADLPFNSLADEPDVDIDVEFRVPAGFRVADLDSVATRFHHVLLHDVDVALSIQNAARPEEPGNVYTVHPRLAVTGTAQNRVSDIAYTVAGGSFVADDGTLSSTTTRGKGDDRGLRITPADPQAPAVTLSASLPDPLQDTAPQNNTAIAAVLEPFDVSLTSLEPLDPTADENGTQQFTATVDRDGFGDDLVYTLVGSPGADLTGTAVDGDRVTLTVHGDTDGPIAIRADLPRSFTDAHPDDNTRTAPFTLPRDVDVALAVADTAIRPQAPGNVYTVPATVAVTGEARNRVSDITYTVTGGKFVSDEGSRTASTTLPKDAAVNFRVEPDDAVKPTVTIAASVPSPLHDTDPVNDTDSAHLSPYDVALTGLRPVTPTADEANNQRFTATVHTDGFPGDLVYTLVNTPGAELTGTTVDGDTATFTVHGDTDGRVAIRADLPAGFTDADGTDNTAIADFTLAREVDIALSTPATSVRPAANDVYPVTASVAVSGPAAGRLSRITYTVTGGMFVDGSSLTSTTTRRADLAAPTFAILPDDVAAPEVTLTASVARPLVDTDPANDTVRPNLARYDVSLSGLTPTTDSADKNGNQTFTATVHDDGLEGLTYRLASPSTGDVLVTEPTRHKDVVTFTVQSSAATAHKVTVEAVLPLGFTDAKPGNNTTSAQWSPQPPVHDVDVKLTVPADPVRPDADEKYTVRTTLTVVGSAAAEVSQIVYTISGGLFVTDDGSLSEEVTRPAAYKHPQFVLTPTNPTAPAVTLTASAPAPSLDTDERNNTGSPRLQPYDVRLSGLRATTGTAGADGNQEFTAVVHDDGFDKGDLEYAIENSPGAELVRAPSRTGNTVTFTVHAEADAPLPITIGVSLPPRFTDADTENNTATSTWTPPAPVTDVDVAVSAPQGPLRPKAGNRYPFRATVTVSGPAADQADAVTYRVHGGSFVGADGLLRRTTTRPVDQRTPAFVVVPTDLAAPQVTLSAWVPAPLDDTDATNDSASLPLAPYDVRLSDLTPTTDSADKYGNQTFTATVHGEAPGALSYRLMDPAYGDTLVRAVRAGDTVTVTIGSRSKLAHQVAVEALLPTGFDDADTRDNIARATFTPHAKTADLRLAASFLWYDKPGKHDEDEDDDDKLGEIEATVWNAPATTLTFTIKVPESVKLTRSACGDLVDGRTATCRVSTPGTFRTTFGIKLPPGQLDKVWMTVTAADYDDPNPEDNTVLVGNEKKD